MEVIRRKCGFQNRVDVESDGQSTGLSLGWHSNCKVSLRSFSRRHIDVMIDEDTKWNTWRCTGFYGAAVGKKKGGLPRRKLQMSKFQKALSDFTLTDLSYVGQWFTWVRGKTSENNIRERLDRGVANEV
ncbi:hypothetical protein GOBAR_AA19279 [Gossypium barbadense]|uniref:Uncharacterized protein n=1 Tax=Gossypium barbadense TaxID=3634 RepID=A0A2P5XDI2_GOSBA|nr:hypothetical protein GOBAR_AA19279 [Gossypium barbadense]